MTVLIEMISDVVCPWCWLGKRRIESAIALVPDLDVQLQFRPYELDPDIPSEGADYKEYMRAKFGGSGDNKDRSNAMRDALIAYGEAEDIPYKFEAITRRPNSINAHRLIRWAQGQDKGAEAKEALFRAFFTEGRDIGETDVLVDIAGQIALDPKIVADLLPTDADIAEVKAEADMYRRAGISGVPTYIANRKFAAQGAETPEKLARFLRHAAEQAPL